MLKSSTSLSMAILSFLFLISITNALQGSPGHQKYNVLLKRSPARGQDPIPFPISPRELKREQIDSNDMEEGGNKQIALSRSNSGSKVSYHGNSIGQTKSLLSSPVTNTWNKHLKALNKQIGENYRLVSVKSESDLSTMFGRKPRDTSLSHESLIDFDRMRHERANQRHERTIHPDSSSKKLSPGKEIESISHPSPVTSSRGHGNQVMNQILSCFGKVANCLRKNSQNRLDSKPVSQNHDKID